MSTALSTPQLSMVPQQQNLCDDWKQEVAERLDAYRAHRPRAVALPSPARTSGNSRASKIANAVASRYAAAPTYSELLAAAAKAAEAEEAARAEARAAEQRAQQTAEAEVIPNLFAGSTQGDLSSSLPCPDFDSNGTSAADISRDGGEQEFVKRYGSGLLTEAMHPPMPAKAVLPKFAARTQEMHLHQATQEPEPSLEDLLASALVEPRAMLPSKLIEFPRELISSRRARPHLPEMPHREQASLFPPQDSAQLRIFEVQPEAEASATAEEATGEPQSFPASADPITMESGAGTAEEDAVASMASSSVDEETWQNAMFATHETTAANRSASLGTDAAAEANRTSRGTASPSDATATRAYRGLEWASISLDKEPEPYRRQAKSVVADYVPFMVDPASIDRRVMAFAVDFALVTAGFLAFLVVFVASTPHLPTGLTAMALAGVVYLALWVLYQMLFFSLSGATAGMLYARIALCTFDDQNPSRRALQRRLAAWWLSLLPLGIGFLWCFVDEDNLCWHDRITRTYQREY